MSLLYPFTDPVAAKERAPKAIMEGRGCYVTDTDGNTYLDAVAGLWCTALGFDNERLITAANEQMKRLPYYHSFMGRTAAVTRELGAKLVKKLPRGIDHVFFGCSGSEAVDTAAKLVRFYQNARNKPEKKKIVARFNAYHGSGQTSAALTGLTYCHDGFDLPGDNILRTGRAHYYADKESGESEIQFSKRRARELDELIQQAGPETVAAFIGEPVMGSGGAVPPAEGYWDEIQYVLKKHDVLLIADEIITGFGRTGTWFACEKYGIQPDLMTLAKQLSAAYFPVSAVGISAQVHDTIATLAHSFGILGHGFTYGGHPVGAAVALEAIKIYEEMSLPEHVEKLSAYLGAKLESVKALSVVGDLRITGLMVGVEMREDTSVGQDFAKKILVHAEAKGVLFRSIDNIVAISPPMNISESELDRVVEVLHQSIMAVVEENGISC
ncbi:MAG: aminotransferase [Desulfobacterales bacterium]|jgi:adenosylmethionine-8-amino-7-oxononanoate aminotransferase